MTTSFCPSTLVLIISGRWIYPREMGTFEKSRSGCFALILKQFLIIYERASLYGLSIATSFYAFSYSRSQIGHVADYIKNQEDHHKKKSFNDEYILFLQKFEIDYNEMYLFEWQ